MTAGAGDTRDYYHGIDLLEGKGGREGREGGGVGERV
jgi:hypothetical protein